MSASINMINAFNTFCDASEWDQFDTLYELGVVLLSPQTVSISCAVGKVLSEYLAARELVLSSAPFSTPPAK